MSTENSWHAVLVAIHAELQARGLDRVNWELDGSTEEAVHGVVKEVLQRLNQDVPDSVSWGMVPRPIGWNA